MQAAESLRLFAAGRQAADVDGLPLDAELLAGVDDPAVADKLRVFVAGLKAGIELAEKPPAPEPCPVVDAKGLGELLGGLHAKSVYRLQQAGKLPAPLALGVSGARWSRNVILDWIDAGCPDKRTWEQQQALIEPGTRRRRSRR